MEILETALNYSPKMMLPLLWRQKSRKQSCFLVKEIQFRYKEKLWGNQRHRTCRFIKEPEKIRQGPTNFPGCLSLDLSRLVTQLRICQDRSLMVPSPSWNGYRWWWFWWGWQWRWGRPQQFLTCIECLLYVGHCFKNFIQLNSVFSTTLSYLI